MLSRRAPVAAVEGVAAAQAQRAGDRARRPVRPGSAPAAAASRAPDGAGSPGSAPVSCRIRRTSAGRSRCIAARSSSLASSPCTMRKPMPASRTLRRSWRMFLRCLWSIAARKSSNVVPAAVRCASGTGCPRAAIQSRVERGVSMSVWKLTCADDRPVAAHVRRRSPAPAPARRVVVARQQPRPGHGRVGHGRQPLREIVQPMLRIGMRPGVVEHELAVRVALQVGRRGRDQRIAVPQGQVMRRPAPVGRQPLLRPAEGMRDEWIAPSAAHPMQSGIVPATGEARQCRTNRGLLPVVQRHPNAAAAQISASESRRRNDGHAASVGHQLGAPCPGISRHPAPPCSRSRPR